MTFITPHMQKHSLYNPILSIGESTLKAIFSLRITYALARRKHISVWAELSGEANIKRGKRMELWDCSYRKNSYNWKQ